MKKLYVYVLVSLFVISGVIALNFLCARNHSGCHGCVHKPAKRKTFVDKVCGTLDRAFTSVKTFATGRPTIKGSGVSASQDRQINQVFDKIEVLSSSVSSPIVVTLSHGDAVKVTVSGDDNVVKLLETDVINQRLVIKLKDGHYKLKKSLMCEITLPKNVNLQKIDLCGRVDVRGKINTKTLDLNNSGKTAIDLQIEAEDLIVDLSGSASVVFAGNVNRQYVDISGSGTYEAINLKSKKSHVKVSGNGQVTVYATEKFDGKVSGAGSITCGGNPAEFKFKSSGCGTVKKI